ncbi:MAG: hypothetical protein WAL97_07410 [Halobacteriota archaeon]
MQEAAWDETYVPPREPYRPKLEDGKRYTAPITRVVPVNGVKSTYKGVTRERDVLDYFVSINGIEKKFRVTKSLDDRSNLYKLAKEFGILPTPEEIKAGKGISGKQLVGHTIRFRIVHSKEQEDGSIFDNIDVGSIEALDTVNDDADDYEAVRDRI